MLYRIFINVHMYHTIHAYIHKAYVHCAYNTYMHTYSIQYIQNIQHTIHTCIQYIHIAYNTYSIQYIQPISLTDFSDGLDCMMKFVGFDV